MPKPVGSGQRYLPGLDGLRALAVLAVIAYHEQFGWARGGLLGVGVFFTLSGFLITGLLTGEWSARGRMRLGEFWLRRARRLLPALFVMLAVVTAWVTVADRAMLAPPAPLDHLWSLAVEEQFYLLWPLLLLAGLAVVCKRQAGSVRLLVLPTLALALVSAYGMAHLYQPGTDPTRVYEGTDTRAFGLLIGAALALAWPARLPDGPRGRRARVAADEAGGAGLIVIAVMVWRVGEYSPFAYRGGMVLLSVATAAVVAAAAWPASLIGAALGWRPLRWIGVRSYGIYLWHYPVIVLTTPANAAPSPARAALQVAAVLVISALSWRLVEEPVRHGALGRLWARARAGDWRPAGGLSGLRGLAATAGSAGVVLIAGIGLSGVVRAPGGTGVPSAIAEGSLQLPVTRTVLPAGGSGAARSSRPGASPRAAAGGGPRTSCRAVAHIGDSTSDGLVSPAYLPDPRTRITARYEDVGVREVITDISGARSVVETLPGQVNGYDAALAIRRGGFRGCWVIALGTDDAADVAAGSTYSLPFRIGEMMRAAHGEPVMWVNVISLVSSGPYAESNMRRWNRALLRACARYPNMRVYNWAAEARRGWFISDGIHYTSLGYEHRAKMIADALARAFPAHGRSPGCVVGS